MSEKNTNPAAETAASDYVAQRLELARKSLKRTRLVGTILVVGVAIYMGSIAYVMCGFFQPDQAARVASGMITQRIQANGPILATRIEQEIPALLHQTPDYIKAQLPHLRAHLADQLDHEFFAYCHGMSADLGHKMDLFIDDHKTEIGKLLANGSDRAAVRAALPDFDAVIHDFVQNDTEGRELKKHIDELAASLKTIETRMARLANATDLTVEEQKARRALAVVTKVASQHALPLDLTTEAFENDGAPKAKTSKSKATL
ncbi:MAG: hypothetical protein RL380_100 [Verrucomicrobiota bacterium]|jgi:hypothetical protein